MHQSRVPFICFYYIEPLTDDIFFIIYIPMNLSEMLIKPILFDIFEKKNAKNFESVSVKNQIFFLILIEV
jgi:hypothetical protein